MKKKIASLLCVLVLAVVMTGCVAIQQYQMTQRDGAKHLIKLSYTISGKNNYNGAETNGTMVYTVEKAKYATQSGEIDILRVTSVIKQDKNTLTTEVDLYKDSLEPIECRKTMTVADTPSLNWTGSGRYADQKVEIKMEAENKELLNNGKGTVSVPYQGVCYDGEQLLLLIRAAGINLGGSLTFQTFNIQNGLSDGLNVTAAIDPVKLPVNVTGMQGGEYDCMDLLINGTGFFTKAAINIKLTNDDSRIPLTVKQGETVYTLTAVEFGEE